MRSRLLFALLVALLMAACGGGGGASCSAPAAIAGTWSGGINDSRAGSGTLTGPDTIGGSFGTVGTNCNSTGSFVLHLQSTSVPTPIPTPTS